MSIAIRRWAGHGGANMVFLTAADQNAATYHPPRLGPAGLKVGFNQLLPAECVANGTLHLNDSVDWDFRDLRRQIGF